MSINIKIYHIKSNKKRIISNKQKIKNNKNINLVINSNRKKKKDNLKSTKIKEIKH